MRQQNSRRELESSVRDSTYRDRMDTGDSDVSDVSDIFQPEA